MTQFARPTSDITTGSWVVTPLWSKVDEVSADDSDYITSVTNADTMECAVSSLTDPVSSTGHVIRLRAQATGSGAVERINLGLVQGTTVIATALTTITRGSFNNFSLTLSAGEADSITNYGDLRIRLTAALAATEVLDVSQIYFECPDAPTGNPHGRLPLLGVG